jgi:hypothetical protein
MSLWYFSVTTNSAAVKNNLVSHRLYITKRKWAQDSPLRKTARLVAGVAASHSGWKAARSSTASSRSCMLADGADHTAFPVRAVVQSISYCILSFCERCVVVRFKTSKEDPFEDDRSLPATKLSTPRLAIVMNCVVRRCGVGPELRW